ncbi:Uncharacterized protein TCM_026151 [Theobroma cacao]|uniref:Uncharacterized protein n=1 Tax=Theobroma cacao TaxID=3641 RepID=A0A061F2D4_THECC|nr:Uncharacterized protein TCM_026151 [Theobroma cacao]
MPLRFECATMQGFLPINIMWEANTTADGLALRLECRGSPTSKLLLKPQQGRTSLNFSLVILLFLAPPVC